MNRSSYIIRYIDALEKQSFDGQLLIGDSSNRFHLNIIKNHIKKKKYNYEIILKHYPKKLPHVCIYNIKKFVKHDYLMWICDDDILIIKTLKKCIQFLDKNKNFSGVGGKILSVYIEKNIGIVGYEKYPCREVLLNNPLDRVKSIISNYNVVHYCLSRKTDFLERFPNGSSNFDKGIGAEFFPTLMLCAQGKVKMLDELFCIRQIHPERKILKSIKKLKNNKNFLYSVNYMKNSLINKILKIKKNDHLKVKREIFKTIDGHYKKLILKKNTYKKNNIFFLFLKKINNKMYFKIKIILHKLRFFKSINEYKKYKNIEPFLRYYP